MKRYIHKILAVAAAVLMTTVMAGCADEVDVDPVKLSETNRIKLKVNVPMETPNGRAAGDDVLNEFKVTSLHLYFFRAEGHADATSEYVFDYTVSQEFVGTTTVNVPLPSDAFKDGGLFGTSGTECIVYAVANVNESLLTAKTVDGIKAIVIPSTFGRTAVQPSFAMDGRSTLTVNRDTRAVSGEIVLERAAAKLTLAVNVPEEITVPEGGGTEETYRSYWDEMRVWISNGVFQSKLNTQPEPVKAEWLYSNTIADTQSGSAFTKSPETSATYKYVQSIPFYSYPSKWEQDILDGNCYLTVEIPWSHEENGTTVKEKYYYRLSVQPETSEIQRNTHYDMRATISRLGGSEDKPVDMKTEWMYVLPWNTETLTTDIKRVRYLLLNNNDYDEDLDAYTFVMDNEEETSITFGSSHEVEIAEVKLTWHDYLNMTDRTITLTADKAIDINNKIYPYSSTIKDYTRPTEQYAGIEVDNATSTLRLKREMLHIGEQVNIGTDKEPNYVYREYNITNSPAFNSYRFDIVLRHADDHSQTAKVRITQYPPIYIEADKTDAINGKVTRFVNNNNTKAGDIVGYDWWGNPIFENVNKGYIIEGSHNYPSDETLQKYFLGTILSESSGWIKNRNSYVITISRFEEAETKDYIIADPRTRTVNNLPVSGSETSSAQWSISDGAKQLLYYYPADSDPNKKRYIAPKLRIASQWGITNNLFRDGALRRCASYQENGRPAGRWRVPTIAEIEFIANLSCKGYIPYLFGGANQNANYWCASGAVSVTNTGTNPKVEEATGDQARSVRCVYDEWYWEGDTLTEANKTIFTWGDRRRTTTGNTIKKK